MEWHIIAGKRPAAREISVADTKRGERVQNVTLEETINLAVLAGEVMLKNGAETTRVEDTMEYIVRACGASKAEGFVIPTGVFLTVTDQSGRSQTIMRRIRDRTINLDRIMKVNELSRRLTDNRMGYDEAMGILNRIAKERTGFSLGPSMMASGTIGGSFVLLLSGAWGEVAAAFGAAALVRYIAHVVSRRHGVAFTFEFLGALAAAATGSLVHWLWPGVDRDLIVVGGIMPLVPGVAVTNAIRDIIAGDLLSGMSRGAEAALTAVAVAMGVVIVLTLSG